MSRTRLSLLTLGALSLSFVLSRAFGSPGSDRPAVSARPTAAIAAAPTDVRRPLVSGTARVDLASGREQQAVDCEMDPSRAEQLVAVLERTLAAHAPEHPAVFSSIETLAHELRRDSAVLRELVDRLRAGEIRGDVGPPVLLALGHARLDPATDLLVEFAFDPAEPLYGAARRALTVVRPDSDAMLVFDPALRLDDAQRAGALRALLHGSPDDTIVDLEQALVEAGLGATWLELVGSAAESDIAEATLARYLDHSDPELRLAACEALAEVADGTAAELRILLNDLVDGETDALVRGAALVALVERTDDIGPVANALRNEADPELRVEAVEALARPGRGLAERVELLRELAEEDPDADVREAAERALGI